MAKVISDKSFVAKWADKENEPAKLDRFTTIGWAKRKIQEQLQAIADINAALAQAPDQVLQDVLLTEVNALEHLKRKLELPSPALTEYVPSRVDQYWLQNRRTELERQRKVFCTYAFWKGEDKHLVNSIATLLNNQIIRYERMSSADFLGPMQAFEEYIRSLENMQLFIRSAGQHNSRCFAGEPVKKIRKDLMIIHHRVVEEVRERRLAIGCRPWQVIMETRMPNAMTLEKFEQYPDEYWDDREAGPPLITDESIVFLAQESDIEMLAESRRQDLDEMLTRFRGRRYALVHGYIRRERKAWGAVLMAVAQWKRHNVWFGEHGYANPRKTENGQD